jgi:hypothetical protein
MTTPPEQDGYQRGRPRLPTGLVVAAVVIALLAVSGLLLLLYRETRGPGEILRQFAQAVDDGDCEGSYELIDASVRTFSPEDWCRQALPETDRMLNADFTLERAVLQGDRARVEVSGVPETIWILRRHGERSWRVVGPEIPWSFEVGTELGG